MPCRLLKYVVLFVVVVVVVVIIIVVFFIFGFCFVIFTIFFVQAAIALATDAALIASLFPKMKHVPSIWVAFSICD